MASIILTNFGLSSDQKRSFTFLTLPMVIKAVACIRNQMWSNIDWRKAECGLMLNKKTLEKQKVPSIYVLRKKIFILLWKFITLYSVWVRQKEKHRSTISVNIFKKVSWFFVMPLITEKLEKQFSEVKPLTVESNRI
jgi:hypothetical protein